jgi:hypothetical protein
MEDNLEEYYTVTTFSSASIGPLNKRQAKIRDHFVRTMDFLGLPDVDVDALSKSQRDEILAIAAQRRQELDSLGKINKPVVQSKKSASKERESSPNKRQWDLRRNRNIKLYKALDALDLSIDDVELLTKEQRGTIYTELRLRDSIKKSPAQPTEDANPSAEYEKLEKIYTSKPEPFVDVSSLLKLVAKPPKARLQQKSMKRSSYNNQEVIGVIAEPKPIPVAKPKVTDKRKPTALCPQPYKKTFVTEELALAFIDKAHPNDKNIFPYPCPCGAIHIGHKK